MSTLRTTQADKDYWSSEDGCTRIQGWARDGLSQEQIAEQMGTSLTFLRRLIKSCERVEAAVKTSKDVVDRLVENALFKRAMGYTYEEVTEERVPIYDETDGSVSGYEMKMTKKVRKTVPPDTTAQIFWLKNRKPYDWRDKKEVEDRSALEKLDSILLAVSKKAEEAEKEEEDGTQ